MRLILLLSLPIACLLVCGFVILVPQSVAQFDLETRVRWLYTAVALGFVSGCIALGLLVADIIRDWRDERRQP